MNTAPTQRKARNTGLTAFGRATRVARITTSTPLVEMAAYLGVNRAMVSMVENGQAKIPHIWIERIETFFKDRGYVFSENLHQLAAVANKKLKLDDLTEKHRMLVVRFAATNFTPDQLEVFEKTLASFDQNVSSTNQK